MHITALAALTSHQSNFSLQPRLRQKRDVDSWPLFCRKHLACSASNARFANFYTNTLRATYSKDLWQIRKLNLIYPSASRQSLRQERDINLWPLFCSKHLAASKARFANFDTNAQPTAYNKDLWQIRKLNLIYR
ncbi:hypothetical protein HBI13_050420 [Parastagonospora nodorum]|nr:hypothetical protein HBI13_050420 [Parastagonospora nodorum]KAH4330737.1 hypothetical protein HBI00_080160 [Parastagonospora nodorum]KAH4855505.1 hypothetical protein HBH75_083270 [Parastagonospora nodorum]KAH4965839.1 hypothetical protein HBH73_064130 [Parastagonospora nodorum]KAH5486773.1 hypothetical protein HBI31_149450 [Parastagonospora nodorum]